MVGGLDQGPAGGARLTGEFDQAGGSVERSEAETLVVYGAAALIESFYTGMEKALRRIATGLGGMPQGEGSHRDLLASMTLALQDIRPAVLTPATAAALDPYLAFRHRFRNLYVFDLERSPMIALLARGGAAQRAFDAEVRAFVAELRRWIAELDARPG